MKRVREADALAGVKREEIGGKRKEKGGMREQMGEKSKV